MCARIRFLLVAAALITGLAVAMPSGLAQAGQEAALPVPREAPMEEPAPADPEQLLADSRAAQARAAQLFRENQFVEAAELLRMAYRHDPRPILLFNAGQAYRKAERPTEAKAAYEEFLAATPEHSLAPEARGYIKDMEALIGMQLRARQVALALEEQLIATQSSALQKAAALDAERLRSLQIQQTLVQTQEQLQRDRKKLLSRRRWILGLSIGIPLAMGAIIGGATGAFYYSRASTDGGTALIGN